MEGDEEFISKTQRKKQAHDLQALGVALSKLPSEQFARIQMPEALREAIQEARRFTRHEAIRRQMQYVGRMMREMDCTPILEQLTALTAPSKKQTALFHRAEKWREEILSNPLAIDEFLQEFPAAEAEKLRAQVLLAADERKTSKTPKQYRILFHMINALVQASGREAS